MIVSAIIDVSNVGNLGTPRRGPRMHKRSAEEEITEDLVESPRKRPSLAMLHQPSQLSQASCLIQ